MIARQFVKWLSCSAIHYSRLDRLIGPLHRRSGRVASIVLYHRVHPDGTRPAWRLTQSVFRAQLRHLTRRYHVMPLDELVDLLAAGRPLPPRAVAVTFDDGYRDNYTRAFPVIQETRCPTTIFLTAGLIGTSQIFWWDALYYATLQTPKSRATVDGIIRSFELAPPNWDGSFDLEATVVTLKRCHKGSARDTVNRIAAALEVDLAEDTDDLLMSWEEAREMVDSGLVTMGAHSLTHRNFTEISPNDVRSETIGSRMIIEERLGRPVRLFAYPFGSPGNDYNDEVKAVVRKAGFTCAVTVVQGLVEHATDLFEIPRLSESNEWWQGPRGCFSRALFDTTLTGTRGAQGGLRPAHLLRWRP